MADDDVGVQSSRFYIFQQFRQKTLNMRLTHFEGDAFFECVTEKEAMNEAGINSRYAYRTSASHGGNALP